MCRGDQKKMREISSQLFTLLSHPVAGYEHLFGSWAAKWLDIPHEIALDSMIAEKVRYFVWLVKIQTNIVAKLNHAVQGSLGVYNFSKAGAECALRDLYAASIKGDKYEVGICKEHAQEARLCMVEAQGDWMRYSGEYERTQKAYEWCVGQARNEIEWLLDYNC